MNYIKATVLKTTVIFCVLLLLVGCSMAQESTVQHLPIPEGLLDTFTNASETNGDVLMLYGQVLDVEGQAVSDATVEIWQTDASGVYDHPRDPSTAGRDVSFQFYGSSQTDTSGWYVFRTILPGKYEPRPRHVHFKVKQNNKTYLTSQFYFSEDIVEVKGEGMFQAIGDSGDALFLQLVSVDTNTETNGEELLTANGQIVINLNGKSGTHALTPSQGEGPYYPVVVVSDFDNDLTILD